MHLPTLAALGGLAAGAQACSNIMIPPGSSVDGTSIISYSADDATLFGDLYTWPAADHAEGELRPTYSWDYGTKLGAIPQPPSTYTVVGNTNEKQLSIAETTFGGLEVLSGTEGKAVCNADYGCLDYGQLIWVTLARAANAKDAITEIDALLQEYGYASEGESFSIADPNEVWLMEIIGKGALGQGAVWVATKIPDGHLCAHANQARTTTFPTDDPTVRYAADVATFAKDNGLWDGSGDFSFSDVYDPVDFEGARFCEARVFSVFSALADASEDIGQYLDYAQGFNLTNRMPLTVKARTKGVSVNDTLWQMRNHFEGLWLDPTTDVGAENWATPYRLGEGLTWSTADGTEYINERFIGTQKAAWSFVANMRASHKYSVLWFGPDDISFSVKTPFYGAATAIPDAYSGSNCTGRSVCRRARGLPGTTTEFSLDSMHWVMNLVANYAMTRYDQIAPVVQAKMVELEAAAFAAVAEMDDKLDTMADGDAVAAATEFSGKQATDTHATWKEYYGTLFATFVDGAKLGLDSSEETCGCTKTTPGFSDDVKQRIVDGTAADRYAVPVDAETEAGHALRNMRKERATRDPKLRTIPKRSIRGV